MRACIGLGANLGDPVQALRGAFGALAALPDTRLLATSRLYRTPAWGRTDQPDYVNAAALLETSLAPQALLAQLLAIERAAGRLRDGETAATRWGPRVLDLDLLLYGDRTLVTNPACGCRIRTCTNARSRWCRWPKSPPPSLSPATAAWARRCGMSMPQAWKPSRVLDPGQAGHPVFCAIMPPLSCRELR